MKKKEASNFYFFDDNYFSMLFKIKNVYLFDVYNLESSPINSAIFFLSGDIAHYHLSAYDENFMNLNGSYFLLDKVMDIAKELGCKYLMLGGGRTNLPDDSLLQFKKKFSDGCLKFYICGKVFNREKFAKYNSLWERDNPTTKTGYFLKYRLI